MNKYLYLIRHASAEEPSYSAMLRDFDRLLNSRGTMEAVRLGKFLYNEKTIIEKIYTSPAQRAFQTAQYVTEQLKLNIEEFLESSSSLYGGGPRGYMSVLNEIPESLNSAAIVGHNPDISFFAEYLTSDDIEGDLEKASLLILTFKDLKWSEISNKSGSVENRIDVKRFFESE